MWFMWFPLFGTFWWIFTVLVIIAIIALEEHEYAGGAFGVLFGWLLVVTFLGDGAFIWKWMSINPWKMGGGAFVYFLLGLPWAITWWWWKQTEKKNEYDSDRKRFCVDKGICAAVDYTPEVQIPDNLLYEWQGSDYQYVGHMSMRAFWTEHRSALTCAMTWWPIHAGSFFFKDFLWSFWRRILDIFGGVFEKIDAKVWGNVSTDFRQVPEEHVPEHRRQRH